jgi:hypothetical protein
MPLEIVHVNARELYVAAEEPLRLWMFANEIWSRVDVPAASGVESVSGGAGSPLWLIAHQWDADHDSAETFLWRSDASGWVRETLPSVAFPTDEHVHDPLVPRQIVVRGPDDVWVSGFEPTPRSAIFSTTPAGPPLQVPDWAMQRDEAVAINKTSRRRARPRTTATASR